MGDYGGARAKSNHPDIFYVQAYTTEKELIFSRGSKSGMDFTIDDLKFGSSKYIDGYNIRKDTNRSA